MDSYLKELHELLAQILHVIPYDEENGIHNLVVLIKDPTTYPVDYTTAFPSPRKPTIYYASIKDEKKAPMRARKEAIHKACIRNFTTYEVAEHETGKLILSVIKDTWVRKIKQSNNYYNLVTMGKLLDHLQATCGGIHALNFLTLKNEMQHYHLKIKGIPEYINELKDT